MPYESVVKALYSYEAADSEELSFTEDELLCILPGGPDSWYLAHSLRDADKAGLIPANYVEPLEGIGILRAIYPYEAQEDNEVTFDEGDLLTLLDRLDEDWWLVRNERREHGLIPSNYVQDAGMETETENIFEQPQLRTQKSLKEIFSNAKVKKKWGAELMQEGGKVKGKLLLLEEGSMVVFVRGKEKVPDMQGDYFLYI